MPVIETRGLTKDFGRHRGIFDLDLEVEKGSVHGFLGPNGAGKSTTLRLLMDFLRPTSGGARIFGRDVRQWSIGIRERVGYLPGDLALPEHLTGRRFLEDSAAVRRRHVDPAYRARLVHALDAQLQPKIRTLSKGNKQKLALIDALQHQPQLLILDEPTDGLDPVLRHRVHDLLREHTAEGGTVFLSSHVVHEIQTTCDQVSIVLDGRLRHSARIADLLAEEPAKVQATLPTARTSIQGLRSTDGVDNVFRSGNAIRFEVQGSILPAMQALLRMKAKDVAVKQHDLEETFLRLYEGGER